MNIKPIDQTDLITEVLSQYRCFWETCWQGHKDPQSCDFNGNIDDLKMLDYCEYEIGHPDNNYLLASIVWANVMQKVTGLLWGINHQSDLYLYAISDKDITYTVNIHQFLLRVIESGLSQYESFSVVTEKLYLDMLIHGHEIKALEPLKQLIHDYVDTQTYSDAILNAIGHLYNDKKDKIIECQQQLIVDNA